MASLRQLSGGSRGVRLAARAALTLWMAAALGIVSFSAASAQTFKLLYSFKNGKDGEFLSGPLALDAKGNLYGAAVYSQSGVGGGTVFKLSKAGKLTVLHAFAGGQNGGGSHDSSGVTRTADGTLYGTTWAGGFNNQGTVFKISKTGKETVLYRFTGGSDGDLPTAGLVRDRAGNLYGTTGAAGKCVTCGTVFKLNQAGKETVLYRLKGAPDAAHVLTGNMVLDANGELYGVPYYGGLTTGCFEPRYGCGTVFKLSPNGKGGYTENVVYMFQGGSDGAYPYSALIRDAAGDFYGTTEWGGNDGCNGSGCGTVFKLDTAGNESVLYTFTGGSDGEAPGQQLVLDSAGNLYGTASNGGNTACRYGCGTVFELDTNGKLTVLHSFKGSDGAYPLALLRDGKGHLYGATNQGGRNNFGALFEITP